MNPGLYLLIKLIAYSSVTGSPITLAMAQQVLKYLIPNQERRITMEAVLRAVADKFQLQPAQLKQKTNARNISYPRQVAMYLIKELTHSSLPEIGRMFYEVGPARGRKGLESYLQTAKARGLVEPSDCALAADQFLSLCKGPAHLQFLLNLIPAPSPQEIRSHVERAVGAFMTLYGSKGADRTL